MARLPIERAGPCTIVLAGEELLAFQGCDYLGLAHHPSVLDAARDALDQGLSCAASRETTGNRIVLEQLEEALAEFLGVEAALVTSGGTVADLAAVQGLSEGGPLCLVDADAHPCLLDAARAAGLEILDYGPGDVTRAHALLDRHRSERVLVLTDGAFPLAGRLAAAAELLRQLPDRGWLVLDDSHVLGVLASEGRGSLEVWDLHDPRVVVTASLAKAFGVPCGAIAGSADVIARVRGRSEGYLGSTPPPPPIAAAARAALEVVQREPRRLERLHANAVALHRIGRRLGIPVREGHLPVLALPVLALPVEDEADGARLQAGLRARGLFAAHVHYPGAPGAGVLRLAVNAEHGAADLRRLEQALAELYPQAAS